MNLVERECVNPDCFQTFKVLAMDQKTITCSIYCFDKIKNTPWREKARRGMAPNDRSLECLKTANQTGTAKSGIAVDSAPQSRLKNIDKKIAKEKDGLSLKKPLTQKTASEEKVIPNIEKEQSKNLEKDTTKIKPNETSSARNGGRNTVSSSEKPVENGTPEIVKKSPEETKNINDEGIPHEVSTRLSETLKTENENSIQLLTNTAKRLIDYADQLVAPRKVDDDGTVIQRSATHELDVAVKCLSEARNVMKTKLEFLKFGKDLIDPKR